MAFFALVALALVVALLLAVVAVLAVAKLASAVGYKSFAFDEGQRARWSAPKGVHLLRFKHAVVTWKDKNTGAVLFTRDVSGVLNGMAAAHDPRGVARPVDTSLELFSNEAPRTTNAAEIAAAVAAVPATVVAQTAAEHQANLAAGRPSVLELKESPKFFGPKSFPTAFYDDLTDPAQLSAVQSLDAAIAAGSVTASLAGKFKVL